MKYNELRNKIQEPIVSLHDIRLTDLKVYPYQLSLWTSEKFLVKLKNGLYLFNDRKSLVSKEGFAFAIYQPSYVSLEWALSHYGIIPEMVYGVTSITSKTTRTFKNDIGVFIYRHVKKDLFFGYKKMNDGKGIYLLAEPEKALLDYLYLNLSKIQNEEDVEELRFNQLSIDEMIDKKKLMQYKKVFNSKKLNRILKIAVEK